MLLKISNSLYIILILQVPVFANNTQLKVFNPFNIQLNGLKEKTYTFGFV